MLPFLREEAKDTICIGTNDGRFSLTDVFAM